MNLDAGRNVYIYQIYSSKLLYIGDIYTELCTCVSFVFKAEPECVTLETIHAFFGPGKHNVT